MKSVGIVACSNGVKKEAHKANAELIRFLEEKGYKVLISSCIYEKNGIFQGTGKEKAEELMKLFRNPEVMEIYDISGGDMANEVLDDLNFNEIKKSNADFWGYSDLTTVINAIYTMTGKSCVLYQIRNLIDPVYGDIQKSRYIGEENLWNPDFCMVQGDSMKGIVVGGNIRCFLKLAGTKYFPDMEEKLLFLEARSGKVPQMVTYLSQLKSCGVFEQINGILLGTFSEMEEKECNPDILSLVQQFVGKKIPIAKTGEIGHHPDSKALWIGKELEITR